MVLCAEGMAGKDVVMKQSAVIDHARDQIDVMLACRRKAKLTGPGLQRIEDDHCPIDKRAKALETKDQIEGKAISGSGCDAEAFGEALIPQTFHAGPDEIVGIPGGIGIVQQEQIEFRDFAPFQ